MVICGGEHGHRIQYTELKAAQVRQPEPILRRIHFADQYFASRCKLQPRHHSDHILCATVTHAHGIIFAMQHHLASAAMERVR